MGEHSGAQAGSCPRKLRHGAKECRRQFAFVDNEPPFASSFWGDGLVHDAGAAPRVQVEAGRSLLDVGEPVVVGCVVKPAEPQTRAVVYLVSLGPFDSEMLDAIAAGLTDEPASTRILALTRKDISTTKGKFKDWGVFGLGNMPGQAAVVSNFRLKRKAKGAKHLRRRIVNTAIHEVGHMLGLAHCAEHHARCPMQDAEGSIANTDASTGHLGPECRAELDRELPAR